MVLNLWKNTTPICAKHLPEKRVAMEFVCSGSSMSYTCPECGNTIKASDFEKIMDSVAKIYIKRNKNKEWGSIQGERFVVSKVIKCEILEQSEDEKYFISIDNPHSGVRR